MPGVLSLIPGLGQIYNKQYGKGILFMVLGFLFVFQIGYNGIEAISKYCGLAAPTVWVLAPLNAERSPRRAERDPN